MLSDGFEPVTRAFRRQVEERPDKVAVWDSSGRATFVELWQQAQRVALGLRADGVAPGTAIGLLGVGGRETIVAMLAVWLCESHVVPLDPEYPPERLARMIGLGRVHLVLVTDGCALPTDIGPAERRVRDLLRTPASGNVEISDVSAGSPAYVLFTSGSTGTPRGVVVPAGAVSALSLRDGPTRLSSDDVFLVHTTLAFDPSMLEIWSSLLVGAAVLCAPRPAMSLSATAALLTDERVSVAVLTPALFALMIERYPEALARLRRLIVGGDVMPVEHARLARKLCPDLDIVNCYGPTENTVVSTAFRLQDWDGLGDSVPIGSPVAGTTIRVLDGDGRPSPIGEVGELFLGGDRLALGYLHDPATTADRFRPDPFGADPKGLLYRTGDHVSVRPDGMLEFHGRADYEVKVRGSRVNLTEVEALVAADPAVREVVAIPLGEGHERRICAFVRPNYPDVDAKALRARLASRIPAHLVPHAIVLAAEYPLNSSGKVDRAALAARADEVTPPGAESALPENAETLTRLWTQHTGTALRVGESFFDAGGTSLDLIRLIDDIANSYGVHLAFEDVYGLRSLDELIALVQAARTVPDS